MRVLITTDTVDGVWTYTRELLLGLLQEDDEAEVLLLTLGKLPSTDELAWLLRTEAQYQPRFHLQTTSLPLEWEQHNESVGESLRMVEQLAQPFAPDVVHSNQLCHGALRMTAAKVVVAHRDVLAWQRAAQTGHRADIAWRDRYLSLAGAGLMGAQAVVAPASAMRNRLQADFPEARETQVIANGIGLRTDLQRDLRLQAFCVTAPWDETGCAGLLREVRSPMPMRVAGAGGSTVNSPVQRRGNVEFVGVLRHDAALQQMHNAAVYVAMSAYEAFDLSALEAARCGCALLAYDSPAMRDTWDDAAWFFSSADELSGLLAKLNADAAALANLQGSSYARSLRYMRHTMVAKYLSLYRELAGNGTMLRG